ncbi:hypothetical protein [Mesobacillus foraminis]|uniref:hypothetical protein n=1 Tax=Mesobacillus foraminis TaxID=279826 RepID=UPI000EF4FF00|nr:hypothetical protein [Mesobacillus foraminis]
MNEAIIMGAYGFLGYSLCKHLLEKGIPIKAITFEFEEEDLFAEEKQMEIGRNANFTASSMNNWPALGNAQEGPATIIIPFYDFFLKGTEENLLKETPKLLFNQTPAEEIFVAILLPEQLVYCEDSTLSPKYIQFSKDLQDSGIPYQEIFLPCLFGPWQPEECLFQQILFPKKQDGSLPVINKRESTTDAIYIDDAVLTVLDLIGRNRGKHLVRSGKSNQWKECIQWFSENTVPSGCLKGRLDEAIVNLKDLPESPLIPGKRQLGEAETVYIDKLTHYIAGIEKQRHWYERWLETL